MSSEENKQETLKVALLQDDLIWEDIAANLSHFEKRIYSLETAVDIIVLPEMFSTGFSMQPEKYAESSIGSAVQAMKKWSKNSGAAICGSLMTHVEGKNLNRLFWVEPDGKIQHYDKRHLFRMGEEQKHYSGGNERLLVEYKGWKIAPFICYDLRFPVWMRRSATFNYDALIFVANWPERRVKHWQLLGVARAIENQAYVVAVNRVGTDGNGIYHNGVSQVVNPMGEVEVYAENTPACLIHELKKSAVETYRESFPVGLDADNFAITM